MMGRIEQLKDFLSNTPDDCFLKHALALEFIKMGNEKEAEQAFRENRAFDPAYVATYYHLGKLLERNGRMEEALAIYREGMQQAMKVNDRHAYGELQVAAEDIEDE